MLNAFSRLLFIVGFIGYVLWMGFNGVYRTVVVEYGPCRVEYQRYWLKPWLPEAICKVWDLKPCGSFVEHRLNNAHAQMLECLCAHSNAYRKNIPEYEEEHYRPPVKLRDADAICKAAPHVWYPAGG